MPQTKTLHAAILICGSLLFGLAASAGVAEVYYRHMERSFGLTPGCHWIADPATGFTNPPNRQCRNVTAEYDTSVAYNSDGYASPEFNPDPHACTVMALGDSHTLAIGVSSGEAWPNVVESRLKPNFQRPFQVINMGVAGYSVGQEYSSMEKYIGKYKPRHVVLGLSMATDFYDIRTPSQGGFIYGSVFTRPYWDVENGVLLLKPAPALPSAGGAVAPSAPQPRKKLIMSVKAFFEIHSALYRAIYRGAIGQYGVRLMRNFGVNPWPNADSVLARNLDPVDQHSWLIVEKLFEQFHNVLSKQGVGFTLVIIPYLPQVYDSVWDRTFASSPGQFDRFAANKRLDQICRRYGLDCLDLTQPFIDAARSSGKWLHHRQDAHPTREGQALIGKLVAEHLSQQLARDCASLPTDPKSAAQPSGLPLKGKAD